MTVSRTIMQRIVAVIALGIAFLVMASVFVPTKSSATDPGTGTHLGTEGRGGITGSLGVIEDDLYRVTIDASAQGPRYSVYRASDGRLLDEMLTARQVAELYPTLPVPDMAAGEDTALMMVDPNTGRLPE